MHELPLSSHSLLQRLQERSEDAWANFLTIYGLALRQFCRSRGLQDADADDVFAEVVTAVEKMLDESRFNPEQGGFRAWLFRVTRNLAVNRFRSRATEVVGAGDSNVAEMLANLPASEDSDSTALWLEYRSQLFHWATEQVRPLVNARTWDAFWRTAVADEDPAQVAAELGMTIGNVYTAKCRVISRIRPLVENLDDPSVR